MTNPVSDPETTVADGSRFGRGMRVILGLVVFVAMLLAPPPAGMLPAAWVVAAVAVLMAIWWLTEALPVAATALVPVFAFPSLGVMPIAEASAPYANPLIFLFLGGFVIALALERWSLHRRVALTVLKAFGSRPRSLIGGFMTVAAALSMWVSNTATTVMMVPIGLSVIVLVRSRCESTMAPGEAETFATSLLLGIAYGASIGGLGTLIGTPPNALLAAYLLNNHGIAVGFGRWMLVGLPAVLVLLPIAWLILTRWAYRVDARRIEGVDAIIRDELATLGAMTPGERRVGVVFVLIAMMWVTRPLIDGVLPGLALSDAGIAIFGALLLFILPAGDGSGEPLLTWNWALKLPWGVLLLFGGGLSLASSIAQSGLSGWIADTLTSYAQWPTLAVLVLATAVVVFLTELTSNTATAAVFLPVAGAVAAAAGEPPILFAAAVALAASCAFMMPVATPPNAIVFGSGHVTIPQMVRAGLWLNLIAILVLAAAAYWLVPAVFGTAT